MAEKVAGEAAVRAAADYIYYRFADMTDAIRGSLAEIGEAVGEVRTAVEGISKEVSETVAADLAEVKAAVVEVQTDVAGVKTDIAEVKASTEGLGDKIDAGVKTITEAIEGLMTAIEARLTQTEGKIPVIEEMTPAEVESDWDEIMNE